MGVVRTNQTIKAAALPKEAKAERSTMSTMSETPHSNPIFPGCHSLTDMPNTRRLRKRPFYRWFVDPATLAGARRFGRIERRWREGPVGPDYATHGWGSRC